MRRLYPPILFIEDQFKCKHLTLQLLLFIKCGQASMTTGDDETALKRGDFVYKKNGYAFPGVVVSVFPTLRGETRVVVEATMAAYRGMLHIFNPSQLTKVEP